MRSPIPRSVTSWRSWSSKPAASLCFLARAGPPVAFGEAWGCFVGVVGGPVWVVGFCWWCGDDAGGQGSFLTLPLASCGGRPRQGFADLSALSKHALTAGGGEHAAVHR